jgi:SRSO17 transposase
LAELAGHASPRRLQALLADYVWDAQVLLGRVRALLVDGLGDPGAVLAIDETAELKAGEQTVAVAPQYAGITGQVENCQTVVFLAYVTARAHALMDFVLYLPKVWIGDAGRRARARVPDRVGFATKPRLAIDLIGRAVAGSVPFAWIVADEVYGRAGQLRAYVESLGKGYVFAVPTSFTVTCADGVHTVKTLAGRVPAGGWSQRSCGAGCKGHRWYEWAWTATSSPTHQVLLRRNPDNHQQVTFFYCHAPGGATLACLVRIAGRRWPVETCFQAAKSILGIDSHQVRLWHSWHRHTTLTLLAAAILAVATAAPAEGEATAEAADVGRPDRGVYVRIGSTNRLADPELIEELRRYASGEAYDEQPMPELDSRAVDFRAASESVAPNPQAAALGPGDPPPGHHPPGKGGPDSGWCPN